MGESTLWRTFNDFVMFWVIIICKNAMKIFLNIDMVENTKNAPPRNTICCDIQKQSLAMCFHPHGFCARNRKKRRDDIIGSVWGLLRWREEP
jgi:hypothetical protein